jgi:hypothetical protein
MNIDQLRARLGDQLGISVDELPDHMQCDYGASYVPTPEEIAEETARIREGWTDAQRIRALGRTTKDLDPNPIPGAEVGLCAHD